MVVFKLPRDNSTDYIKRVIGLPGDHIEVRDGIVYINGQAAPQDASGRIRRPGGRPAKAALRGDAAQRRQALRAPLGAPEQISTTPGPSMSPRANTS